MKKKELTLTGKISNCTQIPFDMLGKTPYIKMCSNREVIIEKAGKIIHYDEGCVRLSGHSFFIEISGRGLRILCLCDGNIRITGFITNLKFE